MLSGLVVTRVRYLLIDTLDRTDQVLLAVEPVCEALVWMGEPEGLLVEEQQAINVE